jgi:type IV pilus assembly protein PilW
MKSHSGSLPHSSHRSQRGLSLIELMISLTIGLLILVSLTSMFVGQTRARSELDKANRMIDNGRYALELLSSSIRMAGYYDSYDPRESLGVTDPYVFVSGWSSLTDAPPCDTAIMTDATRNRNLLALHVQGYNATDATNEIATPPCTLSYSSSNADLKLKAGSDILVIRRASTATPITQATAAGNPNGTIYLQVSSCEYDTTLYKIAAATGTTADIELALNLGQRNDNATDNCLAPFGVPAITDPRADVRPLVTEIYFVSPDNVAGDGIPTLKRRALTRDSTNTAVFVTTPLVEGIEFMQIEYGIDDPAQNTDGVGGVGLDGAPDSYTATPASLAEWSNVVTVKLHLIARNIEPTGGYIDPNTYALGTTGVTGTAGTYTPSGDALNYKRHAYTQLVRLVNVSGRREGE